MGLEFRGEVWIGEVYLRVVSLLMGNKVLEWRILLKKGEEKRF